MAVNRLLCPLHKRLIQRGYSFNKAFDSVEDPWLCCRGGTQLKRLEGECRPVRAAQSGAAKRISLIWGEKGEERPLMYSCLGCDDAVVFTVTVNHVEWWGKENRKTAFNGTFEVSYNNNGIAANSHSCKMINFVPA